jgi:hypothetical protein
MRIIVALIMFLVGIAAAIAQTLDPPGERFKSELLRVYAAPDAQRIRALLHPKSAACVGAEPAYERYLMRAETMQPVPSDAKSSVQAIAADAKLPYSGFEFPVRPSHVVRMEYGRKQSPDGKSSTTQVAEKHIAREGERWYLVFPCPTRQGMERLREMGLLK